MRCYTFGFVDDVMFAHSGANVGQKNYMYVLAYVRRFRLISLAITRCWHLVQHIDSKFSPYTGIVRLVIEICIHVKLVRIQLLLIVGVAIVVKCWRQKTPNFAFVGSCTLSKYFPSSLLLVMWAWYFRTAPYKWFSW